MGERKYAVDVNTDNHFMFFHKPKAHRDRNFKPPTSEKHVSVQEWLQLARTTAPHIMDEEAGIDAAWKAPAHEQVAGYGLNAPDHNGDAAAWAAAGRTKLAWSPTLRQEVAAGAATVATPDEEGAKVATVDPPTRPSRELWYMRASANFNNKVDNGWILE